MKWGVGDWCCFVLCFVVLFLLFFFLFFYHFTAACPCFALLSSANLNMQDTPVHTKHQKTQACETRSNTALAYFFFQMYFTHTLIFPILWDSGSHWTWDRSTDLSFNRPDLKFTSDLYWLFRSVEFGPEEICIKLGHSIMYNGKMSCLCLIILRNTEFRLIMYAYIFLK